MIDREHPLSVVRQAKLLEISRGAVSYRPRQTSEAYNPRRRHNAAGALSPEEFERRHFQRLKSV